MPDYWGTTLTPADVNASNFGVVYAVELDSADTGTTQTASVDHMRITIDYMA